MIAPGRPPALSMGASLRLPLIERWLRLLAPQSVVEVGCGMGAMGYRLATRFDYRGYEPDATSFDAAKRQLSGLPNADVRNSEIPDDPDRRFDLMVAFEVLEHIEDDQAAVELWSRWLNANGHLLLSVPANPERYGDMDAKVGHYRRYSRSRLAEVLGKAGFEVRGIESWGMPVGYLLETARNVAARRRLQEASVGTPGSGHLYQPPSTLGRTVELMMLPAALMQRPFRGTDHGIGFVAVGRVGPT